MQIVQKLAKHTRHLSTSCLLRYALRYSCFNGSCVLADTVMLS